MWSTRKWWPREMHCWFGCERAFVSLYLHSQSWNGSWAAYRTPDRTSRGGGRHVRWDFFKRLLPVHSAWKWIQKTQFLSQITIAEQKKNTITTSKLACICSGYILNSCSSCECPFCVDFFDFSTQCCKWPLNIFPVLYFTIPQTLPGTYAKLMGKQSKK